MKTLRLVIGVVLVVGVFILSGCASTITARPGGETGIPYYLPKPYLLITKNLTPLTEKIIEKKDDKGNTIAIEHTVEPVSISNTKGDSYSFQVIYLPDLTQKYSLKILSRTGEVKTNITLIDGWKFVGLNLEADAKTSEIIKAISEAIKPLQFLGEKRIGEEIKGAEKKEAGLWLYEIKVVDEQLKYELVLQWPPK
ncbi:MAG: hypothetical protein ACK4TF_07135 [Thermodesulfovibrionales bacterium]